MRIPEKICLSGEKHHQTKKMSLNELALQIEIELQRLADEYYEQRLFFKVDTSTRSQDEEIHVTLLGTDKNSLNLLRPDIEHILWKYNRQVLFKQNGSLQPNFLRFSYRLSFSDEKLLIIEEEL